MASIFKPNQQQKDIEIQGRCAEVSELHSLDLNDNISTWQKKKWVDHPMDICDYTSQENDNGC